MEDALLATQNILLGAHSMGLGTCLVGFAVAALQKDPDIKATLGIPPHEPVYSVIALGHPDETYVHQAGRKKPLMRWVS
jgi:nitroreductase